MNINRDNYEMYFLLYVDNELCAEKRCVVEKFVAENPDLDIELALLKQTAIPAERIIFSAKQQLYKTELLPDFLQEQMLLGIDNELDVSQINLLAIEVAEHNHVQQEWNILQQTKLVADDRIIFENKRSLYRYERNSLVEMRIWRVAAAVLLMGMTLALGIIKFSKHTKPDEVAVTEQGQPQLKKFKHPVQTKNTADKANPVMNTEEKNTASLHSATAKITVNNNNIRQQAENKITAAGVKNNHGIQNEVVQVTKKENEDVAVKKETNNLPKPYFENINNSISNKAVLLAVKNNQKDLQNKNEEPELVDKVINPGIAKDPITLVDQPLLTTTNTSYAKQAVLDETNAETGNNSIFLISEEKLDRSKIGGLLKKVKRILIRNADIKTGNSIRLAGFEIATK